MATVKSKSKSKSKRTHILYDLWLADTTLLETIAPWRETLLAAAKESGATIIGHQFHQFSPCGITGFLLLAESHISIPPWPEEGLASVDIFTCGSMNADHIIGSLRKHFQPQRENLRMVKRGILNELGLRVKSE